MARILLQHKWSMKIFIRLAYFAHCYVHIYSKTNIQYLPSEHQHMALCVPAILSEYFTPDVSVLVSMPSNDYGATRSAMQLSSACSQQMLVDDILGILNEQFRWSFVISRPGFEILENAIEDKDNHNYIIFTWPDEEDDILLNVITQIGDITAQASMRPRKRFLVVITDTGDQMSSEVALSILQELWSSSLILDVLILTPADASNPCVSNQPTATTSKLCFYTWFPYRGITEEATQLGESIMETEGNLSMTDGLFPSKVPPEFNIPPVKVSTYDVEALTLLVETGTDEENERYNFTGPEVELLFLIAQKFNFSFVFIPPPPTDSNFLDKWITVLQNVIFGAADVAIAGLPLLEEPAMVLDYTMSYFMTGDTWYVPCSKPLDRLGRITAIFDESLWILIGLVILLVTLVIWALARLQHSMESMGYRSVGACFMNMWAVFMGVSASELPRTTATRVLFIIYVSYCIAMSTVFQAFFTSFLVDPGMMDQLRSLEEIIHSGIEYGYNRNADELYFPAPVDEIGKVLLRDAKNCSDYKECFTRVIMKGDLATLRSEIYAEYFVATTMPSRLHSLCTVDSRFISYMLTIYITKNSPLLRPFNMVISGLREGGIIEKVIKDVKHSWRYQKAPDFDKYYIEEKDEVYFVITTKHLAVAFYLMLVGYGLSVVFLLGELLYSICSKIFSKDDYYYNHTRRNLLCRRASVVRMRRPNAPILFKR